MPISSCKSGISYIYIYIYRYRYIRHWGTWTFGVNLASNWQVGALCLLFSLAGAKVATEVAGRRPISGMVLGRQ